MKPHRIHKPAAGTPRKEETVATRLQGNSIIVQRACHRWLMERDPAYRAQHLRNSYTNR